MKVAPFLANVGLATRGMNEYGADEQASRMREQNISDMQQQARLRGMNEQIGQMGLEDMRQARTVAERTRAAAAGAPNVYQSFEEMANVLRTNGRPQEAMAMLQMQRTLIQEGMQDVIQAVVTNDNVGMRPDLAHIYNRHGRAQWIPEQTSLEKALDGDLIVKSVDAKTGLPVPLPVGKLGTMMGLIKPQTTKLAPSETLLTSEPITGRTFKYTAPEKPPSFAPNTNIEKVKIKDAEGNERDYLWNVPERRWEGTQPPAGTQAPADAGVRRNLAVLKEIAEAVTERPGMAAMDPADPMKKTLTPQGERARVIAERVWRANPHLSPQAAASIGVHSKPEDEGMETLKSSDGRYFQRPVVRYNGQLYPLSGGELTEIAPPKQQPPASKPAATKPVVAQKTVPTAPQPAAVPAPAPSESAGKAETIIKTRGRIGLFAELRKLYPPVKTRTGRGGVAITEEDSPEVAHAKTLRGQEQKLIDYANKLLQKTAR